MIKPVALTALFTLFAAQALASEGGHHRLMFERADTNQDGMVTKDEFTAWRAAQFVHRDRNGDGFIDESDLPKRRTARMDRAERRKKMDSDGDGKISAEEFAAAPAPMFDAIDADHNSVLDANELAAAKDKAKARKRDRQAQKAE